MALVEQCRTAELRSPRVWWALDRVSHMIEPVVFLHGIGAGIDSWDAQLSALPAGFAGHAPPVAGLTADGAGFTLPQAAAEVVALLDRLDAGRAHLCGLSLGAMIALQTAIDYPNRVASLTLSGGQVHPPRALMVIQAAIMRLLPARLVAPPGMSKHGLLKVLDTVASSDFRPHLAEIATPTLVLCGAKDKPNLPAARILATDIPGRSCGSSTAADMNSTPIARPNSTPSWLPSCKDIVGRSADRRLRRQQQSSSAALIELLLHAILDDPGDQVTRQGLIEWKLDRTLTELQSALGEFGCDQFDPSRAGIEADVVLSSGEMHQISV